jgi:ferric enterobactin receptor
MFKQRWFYLGCCLLIALFTVVGAYAQTKTIKGKVVDTSDQPVIGASVKIKGTSTGTITDANGDFLIKTSPKDVLVFSFIGYTSVEESVGSKTAVNIILKESSVQMNDVVVTAMGIKKEKKALGYAVQDLKAEELMKNKNANIINSLDGKIAGVNVTQSSGSAGAGSSIIIRGGTSLSRDNQPLFVVDGVIYDNSTPIGGDSSFDGTTRTSTSFSNRVMDINPEDIENMSVLKGAAAAALYGSRAANGVIVITTKKGSSDGNVSVGFSSKVQANWVNRYPEEQSSYKRGYYDTSGNLIDNTMTSWGAPFAAGDAKYDNIKNFFQTGTTLDNTVNVSGGGKNGTFYLSASRYDQSGIIPNTNYDKTTFRFNGEQKYGKLTVGANVAYSEANSKKTLTGSGLYDGGNGSMSALYTWARDNNMKNYLNADGSKIRLLSAYQDLASDIENPYWIINQDKLTDATARLTGALNAAFKVTDWFDINYKVGLDKYLTNNYTYIAPNSAVPVTYQNGRLSESDVNFRYLNSNLMMNFHKKVQDFDLSLLVGHTIEDTKAVTERRTGYNFVIPGTISFSNIATANQKFTETNSESRLVGVFGEFRASYKSIAYLTATGRNDWSSTLPVANRSYFYSSLGGSFVFTELMPHNDILNFGKVRASWARVGKAADPYVTNTYVTSPESFTVGLGVGNQYTRGNPYLKPEITDSKEVGLELKFLNGRLGFDGAFYSNKSINQIIQPRLSQTTGYILLSTNAGSITNKGVELSFTGIPVKTKNFKWEMTLNLAGNRGKLNDLLSGVSILYVTDVQVGNAKAASFNGGDFMGISGSKWSRDSKGNVILDATTFMPTSDGITTYNIGNREPKFTGGFNNSLQYKNWNLSFLWDIRVGGDIYNGTDYFMTTYGMSKRTENRSSLTISGVVKNSSTGEYESVTKTFMAGQTYTINGVATSGANIIMNYWKTYYTQESSNFMTKTNWLRLRSLSLSYSLPASILSKLKVVKSLSFNVTGNNLLLFTNYKGMDPESSAAGSGTVGSSSVGIDYCGVPSTAGCSFGFNATF